MAADTLKLGLENPVGGSFGWEESWYKNVDILDTYPGIKTVTSATRPPDPWPGQVIFETDSKSIMAFDGTAWFDCFASASHYWTLNETLGSETADSLVYARVLDTYDSAGNLVAAGTPVYEEVS
jgi:hypothetical protein